jgi:hypothetical protein
VSDKNVGVELDLSVYELLGQNSQQLDAFFALYKELMPEYANYVSRMRQRAALPVDHNPDYTEHYVLFTIGGAAAALTTYKYMPARRCGLGIDLAVKPQYRGLEISGFGRFAEYVIVSIQEQIVADAEKHRAPAPIGLFVEVGSGRLVARYKEYGFQDLPIEYCEPSFPSDVTAHDRPLDLDQMTFVRRHVGVFPTRAGEFDPYDKIAITDMVLAFLVDHYHLPFEHWAVQRALKSIAVYCRAGGEKQDYE